MKNKGILIFLIILAVIIVTVVTIDYSSSKRGELPPNPYELSTDPFAKVDTSLIIFKETRNLALDFNEPRGVCFKNSQIFVVGDQKLQIIEPTGKLIREINFDLKPTSVYSSGKNIFVGFRKTLALLTMNGDKITEWDAFSDSTVITSITEFEGKVFVADAGKRIIRKFNNEGKQEGLIEGKSGNDQIHGFIIPSPYFDIAFNAENELWVVNPGKHTFENYTLDGELRTWWKGSSVRIDGFSGCCNPAHFAFMPDGSFVTSEKGIVRIKVYKPSGEFLGVVAAPSKFRENAQAPDLAVDDQGKIYALDLDKKMLRLFIKK